MSTMAQETEIRERWSQSNGHLSIARLAQEMGLKTRIKGSRKDRSLMDHELKKKLLALPIDVLMHEIRKVMGISGKGGETVWAQGIVNRLNYNRQKAGRLPRMMKEDY